MKLRFLQISDLHFQFQNFNTYLMRDKLIEYLSELKKDSNFDFLLLTGDIAHRGNDYNEDLVEYLNNMIVEIELNKENVHLIPGNHDVSRDSTRTLIIEGILKSDNPSEKLDDLDPKSINLIIEGQRKFFNFYKRFMGVDYPEKELHFLYQSKKYNLLSINTCILSDKQGEEGTLLTSQMKLYNAIKKINKDKSTGEVLNLAIGHHTLGCIEPSERESIKSHFDDFSIDMYLAGHVHDSSYNITSNISENPFLELVSGAIIKDEYAIPEFIEVHVDLNNGDTEVTYHVWNSEYKYWTKNNQGGRRLKEGKLNYKISRLEKKNLNKLKEIEDNDEELDEGEFKSFIIDFHAIKESYQTYNNNLDNQIRLDKKFLNMKSSETFKIKFDSYSEYFGVINHIMDSTSYVSADKKDLIAETIFDKYLEYHNQFNNGDEIFMKILNEMYKEYHSFLPYSKALTKKYIKILICWCIYECEIFNDDKRSVIN
ncbi:metallophosphoesterase family protein [Bacillus pumilus]|uniref:metallophosphoesterase family protein n=1 Tax=Bacillus pumilus TaxID=1408 RepID=UPI001B83F40A|nr:metallophosphoesterase [Bacillus pumilus]MBR0621882.1 metallophosphoesterase [Bacillus pumilus]